MSTGAEPDTTGRYIVVVDEQEDARSVLKAVSGMAGIRAVSAKKGAEAPTETESGQAIVFEQLGVAIVDAPPEQMREVAASDAAASLTIVEPERYVYAIGDPVVHTVDYLAGYRDAVLHLTEGAGAERDMAATRPVTAVDESQLTWGIQAVRAAESSFTGRGVRVAVLDTGVDKSHPDLRVRIKATRSFVPGETAADINGHGTHCIGTVGGPLKPSGAPRYGVAPRAELYAGKVLGGPNGRGTDGWIIAGIAWAVEMGCRVVSMSLGAPTRPGEPFRRAYEVVARRAMARGTLIVAAAGNDSRRPGLIAPVSSPANCPSIVAVGALDRALRVAPFSNRGINPSGGQVDLAGPGVDVLSAGIGSQRYRRLSGTSMATPHVAGVTALLSEAFPKATPASLVAYLGRAARRLPLPSTDVGVGLTQAP